jgi:hypothetical protein
VRFGVLGANPLDEILASRSCVKLLPGDQFSSQAEKHNQRDHEPSDDRNDGENIVDEQSQNESRGVARGRPQTSEDRFTDSADGVDSRPVEQDEQRGQKNQANRYGQHGCEQERAHDRQDDSGDESYSQRCPWPLAKSGDDGLMISRKKTGREKPQDQGADKIDRHEYEPGEERGRKKSRPFRRDVSDDLPVDTRSFAH